MDFANDNTCGWKDFRQFTTKTKLDDNLQSIFAIAEKVDAVI